MSEKPWYRDGLRFECTQCGNCCSGAPGVVWVDDQEIAQLANTLEMEIADFTHKFTRRVGRRISLVEYPDGDCVFLDPQKRNCMVYSARPIQCRTWPFWDSNLETPASWQETCEKCPGAGVGKVYSLGEIQSRASQKSL